MTNEQFLKNLSVPTEKVDVILDTDTFNECDDQFAIAYMLNSTDRINCVGITAAPFKNERAATPAEGMEKSYEEIKKLLPLCNRTDLEKVTFRGSTEYLTDEKTPVVSDAAKFIADMANKYSPEHPLYVVAIGAITNVASAILLNPKIKENCVLVWLGGNALHIGTTSEFNMVQDIPAARVVMGCGAPFIMLPCCGVVDIFTCSRSEFKEVFVGKNPLADYLANFAIRDSDNWGVGKIWSRVIWDVTAVAWLNNNGENFMNQRIIPAVLPSYDGTFGNEVCRHNMCYVYHIHRDNLFRDLVAKLVK